MNNLLNLTNTDTYDSILFSHQKYNLTQTPLLKNKFIRNQKRFTIVYSRFKEIYYYSEDYKNFYLKFMNTKVKVKSRDPFSKLLYNFFSQSFSKNKLFFDEKFIKKILFKFNYKKAKPIFKNNILWSLFDINFIRKEKIYTKLKYSRVPQYDIVSGGVAAIFAGFLGFLICEKFGFELLDSGDFYFLFMYTVFTCFFLRLFVKLVDNEKSSWNIFSFKWLLSFYLIILNIFIKKIKSLLK